MPERFVTVIFVLKGADDAEVEELIRKARELTGKIVEARKVEAVL